MRDTFHDPRPLVVHVVYRFDVGGLENGIVNLINMLPASRWRHAVIALTEVTEFRRRIQRDDVRFVSLHKPPGQGIWLVPRMVKLLRELHADVVHTRNLAAVEMSLAAALARVPVRIHGEHGWDTRDPDGRSVAMQWNRRAFRPFVHRYVALSAEIAAYLCERVGVPRERVERLCNGVDTRRFQPSGPVRTPLAGSPFGDDGLWIVGTIGRLQPIKNQLLLARAFIEALSRSSEGRRRMRLLIAGDGPLREPILQLLREAGVEHLAWLAGERADVPDVMRGLDAFVLPSRAEGISNTILEAMATGLPVVATDVGGNRELLEGVGVLVPSADVASLADAMLADFADPEGARRRGQRLRAEAERRFSLDTMIAGYGAMYERALASVGRPHDAFGPQSL